jgi:hypothetical protein
MRISTCEVFIQNPDFTCLCQVIEDPWIHLLWLLSLLLADRVGAFYNMSPVVLFACLVLRLVAEDGDGLALFAFVLVGVRVVEFA